MNKCTAADYDWYASEEIRAGNFKEARLALERRDLLRSEGDTSTAPTPLAACEFTAPEYEAVADDFERQGKHELAALGRLRAQLVRKQFSEERDSEKD